MLPDYKQAISDSDGNQKSGDFLGKPSMAPNDFGEQFGLFSRRKSALIALHETRQGLSANALLPYADTPSASPNTAPAPFLFRAAIQENPDVSGGMSGVFGLKSRKNAASILAGMSYQSEFELGFGALPPSPVNVICSQTFEGDAVFFQGTRPLTESELQRLFHAAGKKSRNSALLLFLFHTGLRITEAAAVKWSDLTFHTDPGLPGMVRVRKSTTKGRRQGAVIPLHPRAQAALRRWLDDRQRNDQVRPGDFVFPGQGGHGGLDRRSAWEMIKRLYSRAGITGPGCALHSLRKSFGTQILARTKSVETVRRALRHARLETSKAYIAPDSSEIAEAILSL